MDTIKHLHLSTRTKIGQNLRDRRKEKGLTLKQTQKISGIDRTQLSRLEKGTKIGRNNSEYLRYLSLYANAIEVNLDELGMIKEDKEQRQRIEAEFEAIEHKIHIESILKVDSGVINELDRLDFDRNSGYMIYYHYIRGLYFYLQGNCDRTEKELSLSIEYSTKFSEYRYLNLRSLCHHLISDMIYQQKEDTECALEEIDEALHYFVSANQEGEPPYQRRTVYWECVFRRATYLDELQRYVEADRLIEYLIDNIDQMVDKNKTGVYHLKAKSECRKKHFEEAVKSARIALGYALSCSYMDKYLEISVLLGDIYVGMNELQLAERIFQYVIQISPPVNRHISKTIESYLSLGELLLKQNKINEVKILYEKAKEICQKEEYRGEIYIELLINIGDYMYKVNHHENALLYFEEVASLLKNNSLLQKKYAEVFFKLAICYNGFDQNMEVKYMRLYQHLRNPF
ncbi:helix-turn-helix domain-containing protein [Marininema halotolerans]|uniref:Helix-turn-helix n=1 Tax=Marininema halotolerans TaxID=1155944 RepID=A0A1I6REB3_9BACL|nr:helix-turn-helix transcriptional regulator [Marininema halotolerans]SFS63014.1 Helix-turn-helix [Marininema halotolerans]